MTLGRIHQIHHWSHVTVCVPYTWSANCMVNFGRMAAPLPVPWDWRIKSMLIPYPPDGALLPMFIAAPCSEPGYLHMDLVAIRDEPEHAGVPCLDIM